MKINSTPVAPGTYQIDLDQDQIEILKKFESLPKEFFQNYCVYLASELMMEYVMHQVYDYKYVIEKGHITQGSNSWHNDKDSKMDCILMLYVVDPDLNERTGMRVGYRDADVENSEKYMDLKTGSAFLTRQDKLNIQHRVEEIKGKVNYRSCVSINLQGFKDAVSFLKLQE